MLPILQIGPLTLRTPGLALLAGLWFGLEFASREGIRRGINEDRLYSIGLYTIVAGVLGARFAFVLLNLPLYTRIAPWTRALGAVFALAPGTEVAWIGLIIALAVAYFFIRRWELPILHVLDAYALGGAVFMIFAAGANLLSGEYYGVETLAPWGINLWGARRHPTQIYLLIASGAALYAGWQMRITLQREAEKTYPPGMLAQVVVAIISSGMMFIEPLRADSPVIGPGVRLWSVVAMVMILGVLAGFIVRAPKTAKETAS